MPTGFAKLRSKTVKVMIEIFPDGRASRDFGEPYSHSGKLLGRFIMPITSRLRSYYGLKGIKGADSHLDIGCGDCLFLKKSPCQKRVGLDLRYGDEVSDHLDFADGSFDNISMLAVLEHIASPDGLIREIHRVLKPGGHLIITTPRKAGEWLIQLYSKDVEAEEGHGHEAYYDKEKISELTKGLFDLCIYLRFLFGLNQLFVCKKV